MQDKLLYVFDETAAPEKAARYCGMEGAAVIYLCPITTSEKAVSSATAILTADGKREVRELPYLDRFHKLAFSERDKYIGFIRDFGAMPRFGGKSLREYFRCGASFSAWWLSLIAEKNTFKTDSYNSLIKFLVITSLAKENGCGRILLDIRSSALSRAVAANEGTGGYKCRNLNNAGVGNSILSLLKNFAKGIKSYLYLVYKFFTVTTRMKSTSRARQKMRGIRYIAITYFPFVDRDALRQNKFVNKYYAAIQPALEARYKDKFMWLALTLDIDGYDFRKSVELARQIKGWGYPLLLVEEALTIKDLLVIPWRYLRFASKFFIKAHRLAGEFKYTESGWNLWEIFKDDWFSSFSGAVLMNGLAYHRLFENLSRSVEDGSTVIYLAENQGWEKAMNAVFREGKDLRTVGIIHTTAPLLYLPYFDFKDSLKTGPDDGLSMPAPDCLACSGNITWKLLVDSGWGSSRAFPYFAVRYQHLRDRLKEDISWVSRQDMILISLTSTTPNQVREMLLYINEAFKGREGYRVVIKEHYAYPLKSLLKRLNVELDEKVFYFSNENLDTLLRSAKAIVVSDSSVSLDSMAFACPVIIPRLSSVVDTNPLSRISDMPIYVNSPKELRDAVETIIRSKGSPVEPARCKGLVKDYFEMVNDGSDLLAEFETHLSNCRKGEIHA